MVFFIFKQILIDFSVSKQETPSLLVSDLGLHCLPMSHKKDSRFVCVIKIKSQGPDKDSLST